MKSLSVVPLPDFSTGKVKVKALSPITVYSTLYTPTGKKKIYYYHPHEQEFADLIADNLAKKAVYFNKNFKELPFSLRTLKVNNRDASVVLYLRLIYWE